MRSGLVKDKTGLESGDLLQLLDGLAGRNPSVSVVTVTIGWETSEQAGWREASWQGWTGRSLSHRVWLYCTAQNYESILD